jgi:hypothetical protein
MKQEISLAKKFLLALTILIVPMISFTLLLWQSRRLHLQPFLICLTPIPSATTVVDAIRFGPGDGGPGVGNDGREYAVRPLTCPQSVGAATPKLTMWLRVTAQGQVIDEGVLRVGMISEHRVVLFGFQSHMGKSGTIRVVGE